MQAAVPVGKAKLVKISAAIQYASEKSGYPVTHDEIIEAVLRLEELGFVVRSRSSWAKIPGLETEFEITPFGVDVAENGWRGGWRP